MCILHYLVPLNSVLFKPCLFRCAISQDNGISDISDYSMTVNINLCL